MGSTDTFHQDNPRLNQWMEVPVHSGLASDLSVQEKRKETARVVMSGLVQRLALRLGISPEELAERIPADTINRTKFPVQERLLPDGTIEFQHPSGIIEGVRGTHSAATRQT